MKTQIGRRKHSKWHNKPHNEVEAGPQTSHSYYTRNTNKKNPPSTEPQTLFQGKNINDHDNP
jgi:hypothetical protein